MVTHPAGRRHRSRPAATQFRNVLRMNPQLLTDPTPTRRPCDRSRRASTASRTARSRSSSGYFLGAPMTLTLPWNEILHQTRAEHYPGNHPRLITVSSHDQSRLARCGYADQRDTQRCRGLYRVLSLTWGAGTDQGRHPTRPDSIQRAYKRRQPIRVTGPDREFGTVQRRCLAQRPTRSMQPMSGQGSRRRDAVWLREEVRHLDAREPAVVVEEGQHLDRWRVPDESRHVTYGHTGAPSGIETAKLSHPQPQFDATSILAACDRRALRLCPSCVGDGFDDRSFSSGRST